MSGAFAGLKVLGTQASGAAAAPSGDAEDLKQKLLDALGDAAPMPTAPTIVAANESSGAGDELDKLSIKELKQRILATGSSLPPGVTEKAELVDALRHLQKGKTNSEADKEPDKKRPKT